MEDTHMKVLFLFFLICQFAYANPGQLGFSTTHDEMNQEMLIDHMTIMRLTRTEIATIRSVESGEWDNPKTWGGNLPQQGDRVYIAAGHTVLVDSVVEPSFMTIRVDGTLKFSTENNSTLKADTLFINDKAYLEMGTKETPVNGDVSAKIIIDDLNGGFERENKSSLNYDPFEFGQGLIIMGQVKMAGVKKTPYVTIKQGNEPREGDIRLNLDHRPSDWEIGDTLLIAGTGHDENDDGMIDFDGDEVRTVVGVESGKIILDKALEKNHLLPRHTKSGLTLHVYVANLTRNVVVETAEEKQRPPALAESSKGHMCEYKAHSRGSRKWVRYSQDSIEEACEMALEVCRLYKVNLDKGQAPNEDCYNTNPESLSAFSVHQRGHVMFMHTNNVDINYAGFYHLGRTDKDVILDDTLSDEAGNITKLGKNQRARYSVHFHRAGAGGQPGLVRGSVATHGSGWAFVNHGSFAHMRENIAYDFPGAGFVAERSDERGSYIGNLAVKLTGDGDPSLAFHPRDKFEDHGYGGHGLWIQSPLLLMTDNVVIQANSSAFGLWNKPMDGVSHIDASYLPPEISKNYDPTDAIGPQELPVVGFENNRSYGTRAVFGIGVYHPWRGTVSEYADYKNNVGVNTKIGVETTYSSGHRWTDFTLINNIDSPWGQGVNVGPNFHHYQFVNNHIEGFLVGIRMPPTGELSLVSNGYFNNVLNLVQSRKVIRRELELKILDNKFGKLSGGALEKGLKRVNSAEKLAGGVLMHSETYKGQSFNWKRRIFDKQYNYAFFDDPGLNSHWPQLLIMPTNIIVRENGVLYKTYFKKEQNPDYIPWPRQMLDQYSEREVGEVRAGNKKIISWMWDMSNQELKDKSIKDRDAFFYGFQAIDKSIRTQWRHKDYGRQKHSWFKDWQWASQGGYFYPKNWKELPEYVDGETMSAYNTIFKKIEPEKVFFPPIQAVDDTIVIGTKNAAKLEDGTFKIRMSSSTVTKNDIHDPNLEQLRVHPKFKTKNGGRFVWHPTAVLLHAKVGRRKYDGRYGYYTPPENLKNLESFTDSFEYTVMSLRTGSKSTAKVTMVYGTPTEVVQTPVAVDDSAEVEAAESVEIDVLDNDSHPGNKSFSINSVGTPYYGTASISEGSIIYQAPGNFQGTTSFSYTISDDGGALATAQVNVNVTKNEDYGGGEPVEEPVVAPNPIQPPNEEKPSVLAVNDFAWMLYHTTKMRKNKVVIKVLQNDIGKGKRVISVTNPKHGTITRNGKRGGRFVYKLTEREYSGWDTVSYTMQDKHGEKSTAIVNIEIKETDELNFPDGNTE